MGIYTSCFLSFASASISRLTKQIAAHKMQLNIKPALRSSILLYSLSARRQINVLFCIKLKTL